MPDIAVPLVIDPDQVANLYARDPETGQTVPDFAVDAIGSALSVARGQALAIADLATRLDADPTRSGPSRALELRRAALRAGERAAEALDRARQQAQAERAELEMTTSAPALPSPEAAQYAAETRAALRSMSESERAKAIAGAIANGEDLIIAAVLRAPALLSGLSPDEQGMHRDNYRRLRHPGASDRLARLDRALAIIDQAGNSLVAFTARATAAGEGAAERAAAANAALEALTAEEGA